MCQWSVLAYCCFGFYQTLTILISSPFPFLHGEPFSCSLVEWRSSSLFHYLTLFHLLRHTHGTRKSWLVPLKQSPPGFLSLFWFFPIMITHNGRSLLLYFVFYFHSVFLFKVFIHFDFILHSSLFLIFLPRPLYSRLQHPAMQTQPVLRGSELLKLLLPFPLCRSGPQRKEGGNGGRNEGGWKKWRV